MIDSMYIGLTGLTGFSTGISNVSHNVVNLNTPGFKSVDLRFADLFYDFRTLGDGSGQGAPSAFGSGLQVGGTLTLFTQGELQSTGNDQDAAIDGPGFFVLRKDGETFYTRAGQFQFDQDGFLVARGSGARVAGLGAGDRLQDINIGGVRATQGTPTSTVRMIDNLSVGDSTHEVSNVTVFDSQGTSRTLRLVFTNNNAVTPRNWLVQVFDATGATVSNGEVRFSGDGSPTAGFNAHTFTYSPPGIPALTITLDMGQPGSFSGATNFSAGPDSTLRVGSQDGIAPGSLTRVTFDEQGFLVTEYSNGQTFRRDRLALANFDYLQGLEQQGNNLFVDRSGGDAHIGGAGEGEFGRIRGGQIELSNVDLAQQFTELIVIQRGFQAASQVITTSNEMIQQLFDINGGR